MNRFVHEPGPEDTPYGFGCFLFDIHFSDYPKRAPQVKFLTTGGGRIRFNPNLYQCGKVCLSLLGTWSGPGWQPNASTLLQVLVSIQGLILVPDPYYNEPGFSNSQNSKHHQKQSERYTQNIRRYTIQHGMIEFVEAILGGGASSSASTTGRQRVLYPEFGDVISRHFSLRAPAIREQVDAWLAEDRALSGSVQRLHALLDQLQLQVAAPAPLAAPAEGGADEDDNQRKPAALPANGKASDPVILTIDDDDE